jgi:hypothetical protein
VASVRFVPLVGLLLAGLVVSATPSAQAGAPAPPPTNAGKIFKWGNAQWDDDFVGPLKSMWRVNRPSMVRNQHGMLTINATEASGSVVATATGHDRRYGRWEARVRGRQYGTTGTPFTAVWELVPVSGGYHCGARSVVLGQYPLDGSQVSTHVRNLPSADFRATKALRLSGNTWHTYAVEVTPDHVSWFVDTRVIRTEPRPAALSGAVFAARFRLVASPTARMRQGRMQMDWVRYYTLARKNAQPITAPRLTQGSYADAC